MGIGGGIALLVIGAILAFGVRDSIDAIDLTVIGYILMGAGALALILAIVINAQRSRTSHTEVIDQRTTAVPPTAAPQAVPPAQNARVERTETYRETPPPAV